MTLPRIDYESLKPGDRLTVMVGGQPYETIITEGGVQRFIEDPNNALYRRLRTRGGAGGEIVNPSGDILDLNEMAVRYHKGEFSQREYAELNMALGYSVGGFCELSNFQNMDIDNPIWEEPKHPDPFLLLTFNFHLTSAAAAVFRAVLEEGTEALDYATNGTQAARDEARAVIEDLLRMTDAL